MIEDDKNDPAPASMSDAAGWEQREQEHSRRLGELLLANKTALFNALAAADIEIVDVNFDDYGDSGQIENIEARRGDEVIELPVTQIEIVTPVWDSANTNRQTMTVQEAIEYLVYELLGDTHGGWENDDGAYGDFILNVSDRTVTLDYNERYTATNYSHHSF